jgi:hypothetical protein
MGGQVFFNFKKDIFETLRNFGPKLFLRNGRRAERKMVQKDLLSVTAHTCTNSVGPATPSTPPSVTWHQIPPRHKAPAAPPKNLPKTP